MDSESYQTEERTYSPRHTKSSHASFEGIEGECLHMVYKCSQGLLPWLIAALVITLIFLVVGIIAASFTVSVLNPDGSFNTSVSTGFVQAAYALIMISLIVASFGFLAALIGGSIWASRLDRALYGNADY